eukprot:TRINITY_DN49069_c0_g1_i1.p5 TRINITY_DN49069_c0_g1~~TRINITY_DN49069_c0_g1_i1.p5  ORF type:complete len:102 (+),score=5.07 TRINITY_DN49069_c0_g1_i1:1062-1367(+)
MLELGPELVLCGSELAGVAGGSELNEQEPATCSISDASSLLSELRLLVLQWEGVQLERDMADQCCLLGSNVGGAVTPKSPATAMCMILALFFTLNGDGGEA